VAGQAHHTLHASVLLWDTLEALQALHCAFSAMRLMRNHATDAAVEDASWRTEVVRAMRRIGVCPLAQLVEILQLVTVERS